MMSAVGGGGGDEPEWPIQLYRQTKSFGWQILEARQGKQEEAKTTTNERPASWARKRRAIAFALKASPRKDAIIVRRLRLRISIEPNSTVVSRRRNRVSINSQQGTRSLMLLFRNATECRAFSERFQLLNPIPFVRPPELFNNNLNRDAATNRNRNDASNQNDETTTGDTVQSARSNGDTADVLSYISSLLQTPDFLDYTINLQSIMEHQPEVRLMLEHITEQPVEDLQDIFPIQSQQNTANRRLQQPPVRALPGSQRGPSVSVPWPEMNRR